VLVRYCDDFVVLRKTEKNCREAERRVRKLLGELMLELHPEDEAGRSGLGQARDRLSRLSPAEAILGAGVGEVAQARVLPPALAVDEEHEADPTAREGADHAVTLSPGPSRRDRGAKPGAARLGAVLPHRQRCDKFSEIDKYVTWRLKRMRVQRKGRHLKPGEARRWNASYFHALGLHKLVGTVRYPEAA
jgi:hypothetical protein